MLEPRSRDQLGDPHVLSLVDQDWGFSDISIDVDLSNDKIRNICARYKAIPPASRFIQNPIAAGPPSVCQDARPYDHPIEITLSNEALLNILVVVSAPKENSERDALKASDTVAAVPCSESCHADEPPDTLVLHRGNENARGVREKADRPN